jgi:hypothetical protein
MHLQRRRERAGAGGLVEPRQPLLAAMALINDILDHEGEAGLAAGVLGLCRGRLGQHRAAQRRGTGLQQRPSCNIVRHDASLPRTAFGSLKS